MRRILIISIALALAIGISAQEKVGIGVTSPSSILHIHDAGSQPLHMQVTNLATGTSTTDGLHIGIDGSGNAELIQKELGSLSFGTLNTERLYIASNGHIGMNTQSSIGASDLVLRSTNSTTWGGMYIESPDAAGGRPFYGYAIDGVGQAWHYFDQAADSWKLYVSGDKMAVTSTGEVGIGTNTPSTSAILELNSTSKGLLIPRMTTTQREGIASPEEGLMVYDLTQSKTYYHDGGNWQDFSGVGGQWSVDNSPTGIYYQSGNVGIGAGVPFLSRLWVDSGSDMPTNAFFNTTYSGGVNTYGVYSSVSSAGTGNRWGLYGKVFAPTGDDSNGYGVYGIATANGTNSAMYGVYGIVNGTGTGPMYGVYGLANYDDNVAVYGKANLGASLAGYFEGPVHFGDGTIDGKIIIDGNTTDADIMLFNELGEQTIEIDADWESSGSGRIRTDELQILGGSDLAEYFSTAGTDAIPPGSVVCIDPENPGNIRIASKARDKKVIGVVSGANGIKSGMLMGQEGSVAYGDTPVAVAGRVYVRVDESQGAVEPGDFLTSSDKAGYAKRVKKFNKSRGAILGKALTYSDEAGFVLMLVQLQ